MKEKITKFGKTMPIVAIALLLFASIGVATLLEHYGQIKGDVTVTEAITLSGADNPYTLTGIGGNTYVQGIYTIKNNAQVPVTMNIMTTTNPSTPNRCEGITPNTYRTTATLSLTNKDPNDWSVIGTKTALLTYNVMGDTFDYEISVIGLSDGEYSIIYYPDDKDRFVNWNSPGALIGIFNVISGTVTEETETGSASLGMNLPKEEYDANINIYNYCEIDGYETCFGAKIWIVPSSSYTTNIAGNVGTIIGWDTTLYLFETDMIHYYNTESGNGIIGTYELDDAVSSPITIQAGDSMEFIIKNSFLPNVVTDGCEITVSLDVPTTL